MHKLNSVAHIWKTALLTFVALIAFAANSVLCRMALADNSIDASSFTSIRLISGSVVLLLLVFLRSKFRTGDKQIIKGSWTSGAFLFLYAACFSFAYITLDAGVGALIAFASVQITMISYALIKGRKLNNREWIGVILAFAGFVYLVSPGINAPPLEGFVLMTVSGFGWGMYSVRGKTSENPLEDTSFNFLRSLPYLVIVMIIGMNKFNFSERGVLLAIASGAVTSGIGYTIWYMALNGLNNVQASVVQLSVPALAAAGGILLLSEELSLRFVLSSTIILGGIYLVITGKRKFTLRQ